MMLRLFQSPASFVSEARLARFSPGGVEDYRPRPKEIPATVEMDYDIVNDSILLAESCMKVAEVWTQEHVQQLSKHRDHIQKVESALFQERAQQARKAEAAGTIPSSNVFMWNWLRMRNHTLQRYGLRIMGVNTEDYDCRNWRVLVSVNTGTISPKAVPKTAPLTFTTVPTTFGPEARNWPFPLFIRNLEQWLQKFTKSYNAPGANKPQLMKWAVQQLALSAQQSGTTIFIQEVGGAPQISVNGSYILQPGSTLGRDLVLGNLQLQLDQVAQQYETALPAQRGKLLAQFRGGLEAMIKQGYPRYMLEARDGRLVLRSLAGGPNLEPRTVAAPKVAPKGPGETVRPQLQLPTDAQAPQAKQLYWDSVMAYSAASREPGVTHAGGMQFSYDVINAMLADDGSRFRLGLTGSGYQTGVLPEGATGVYAGENLALLLRNPTLTGATLEGGLKQLGAGLQTLQPGSDAAVKTFAGQLKALNASDARHIAVLGLEQATVSGYAPVAKGVTGTMTRGSTNLVIQPGTAFRLSDLQQAFRINGVAFTTTAGRILIRDVGSSGGAAQIPSLVSSMATLRTFLNARARAEAALVARQHTMRSESENLFKRAHASGVHSLPAMSAYDAYTKAVRDLGRAADNPASTIANLQTLKQDIEKRYQELEKAIAACEAAQKEANEFMATQAAMKPLYEHVDVLTKVQKQLTDRVYAPKGAMEEMRKMAQTFPPFPVEAIEGVNKQLAVLAAISPAAHKRGLEWVGTFVGERMGYRNTSNGIFYGVGLRGARVVPFLTYDGSGRTVELADLHPATVQQGVKELTAHAAERKLMAGHIYTVGSSARTLRTRYFDMSQPMKEMAAANASLEALQESGVPADMEAALKAIRAEWGGDRVLYNQPGTGLHFKIEINTATNRLVRSVSGMGGSSTYYELPQTADAAGLKKIIAQASTDRDAALQAQQEAKKKGAVPKGPKLPPK